MFGKRKLEIIRDGDIEKEVGSGKKGSYRCKEVQKQEDEDERGREALTIIVFFSKIAAA